MRVVNVHIGITRCYKHSSLGLQWAGSPKWFHYQISAVGIQSLRLAGRKLVFCSLKRMKQKKLENCDLTFQTVEDINYLLCVGISRGKHWNFWEPHGYVSIFPVAKSHRISYWKASNQEEVEEFIKPKILIGLFVYIMSRVQRIICCTTGSGSFLVGKPLFISLWPDCGAWSIISNSSTCILKKRSSGTCLQTKLFLLVH